MSIKKQLYIPIILTKCKYIQSILNKTMQRVICKSFRQQFKTGNIAISSINTIKRKQQHVSLYIMLYHIG